MSAIDDFKSRFPEFDTTIVDSRFATIYASYTAYYDFEYATATQEVILNLVAHLLYVDSPTAVTGAQASAKRTVTSTSTTSTGIRTDYARPDTGRQTVSDAFFGSTAYGQRFLMLKSLRVGGCYA